MVIGKLLTIQLQVDRELLFMIRFTYIAVLLIFTQLLIPAFRPGGRFIILLIASVTACGAQVIRKITAGRGRKLHQTFLSSVSIIIALFLSGYYFSGVKPTILGIIVAYLGLVFLETLLPGEWYQLIYQKYQRPD